MALLTDLTIRPTFDQAKNHNKRFGEFEFKYKYFRGSDVANKIDIYLGPNLFWTRLKSILNP